VTHRYQIVVIGAGHAGCEAARACARLGLKTAMITMNLDLIAQMSCNPAVGGIAKGHLVREIDALGGEPGVRSHRWLNSGGDDSDAALVAEVIRRMKDVPSGSRGARLRAATALIYDDDDGRVRERIAEAAIEGVIAERAYPQIRAGFPYRAVLFMPERGCYVGELGDEEEAKISQRRIALNTLRDDLARIAAGRSSRL